MYLKFISDTVEIFLEKYELRQRIYIKEGRYKTATHHVDVSYQISILFEKVFRETFYYFPYVIPYAHKWKHEELERRSFIRKTVKILEEERKKTEGCGTTKKKRKSGEGGSSGNHKSY